MNNIKIDTIIFAGGLGQRIGKTGVEMKALTAVSVSLLTIYDMCKAVEKTMCIQNIQ